MLWRTLTKRPARDVVIGLVLGIGLAAANVDDWMARSESERNARETLENGLSVGEAALAETAPAQGSADSTTTVMRTARDIEMANATTALLRAVRDIEIGAHAANRTLWGAMRPGATDALAAARTLSTHIEVIAHAGEAKPADTEQYLIHAARARAQMGAMYPHARTAYALIWSGLNALVIIACATIAIGLCIRLAWGPPKWE